MKEHLSFHRCSNRELWNKTRSVVAVAASASLIGTMLPIQALAEIVPDPAPNVQVQEVSGDFSIVFDSPESSVQMDSIALPLPEELQWENSGEYSFNLPACEYSKQGHVFAGWKVNNTSLIETAASQATMSSSESTVVLSSETDADSSSAAPVDENASAEQPEAVSLPLIPDGVFIENMSFPCDVDGDGKIGENEHFSLVPAADADGMIKLSPQWAPIENVVEDDQNYTPSDLLVSAPRVPLNDYYSASDISVQAEDVPNPIDNVDVAWIDNNGDVLTQDELQRIATSSASSITLRAKVSVSVKAESDILAGQLKIKVPKYLFRDRDGNPTGEMTLAVPQAPSTIASFAYDEDGDDYVISNMKRLARTNRTNFEFSFLNIKPSLVKDYQAPYSSDPFFASVSYDNGSGNVATKDSRQLIAELDTKATIKSVGMREGSSVSRSSIPESVQLPENPDDYYYYSFYAYANTTSNQPYSLSASFKDTSNIEGAIVLNDTLSAAEYPAGGTNGSSTSATVGYTNFYVAYPKTILDDGEEHILTSTVSYTLVSSDDKEETVKQTSASATYKKYVYVPDPPFIPDPDPEDPWVAPDPYYSNRPYLDASFSGVGSYRYYLNKLLNGQSATVRYSSRVTSLYNNADPTAKENSHVRSSAIYETSDFLNKTWDENAKYISSISLGNPLYYSYGMSYNGYYGSYTVDPTTLQTQYSSWFDRGCMYYMPVQMNYPVVFEIEGDNNGSWEHVATATWHNQAYTIEYSDGKKNSTATVSFPDCKYSKIKVSASCEHPSISWSLSLNETIMPTDEMTSTLSSMIGSLESGNILNISKNDKMKMFASISVLDTPYDNFNKNLSAMNSLSSFAYGTSISTSGSQVSRDMERRNTVIEWNTNVTKTTNLSQTEFSDAISCNAFEMEKEGRFFLLLPKGQGLVPSSLKIPQGRITNVETHKNWRGSGRTMIEVSAEFFSTVRSAYIDYSLSGYGQKFSIGFKTNYSYDAVNDYGMSSTMNVAYVSNNKYLGNVQGNKGEKDTAVYKGNSSTQMGVAGVQDLMRNLTGNPDVGESVVYSASSVRVVIDRYDFIGISKRVSVLGDEMWTNGISNQDERNTYPGGLYTYKIRSVFKESPVKDAVIYDVLDSYHVEDGEDVGDSTWKGTLLDIDLSAIRNKGIAPKVYYSTSENIDMTHENTIGSGFDTTNTDIWSTEKPEGKITAIAVDISKTENGDDYVMQPGDAIDMEIHMLAPNEQELFEQGIAIESALDGKLSEGQTEADGAGAHAYNSAFFSGTVVDSPADNITHREILEDFYTKVGLIPYKIKVAKTWNDSNDNDRIRPESATFDVVRNGEVLDTVNLSKDNDWSCELSSYYPVDERGIYSPITLKEHAPKDYVPNYRVTDSESEAQWSITNAHTLYTSSLSGSKTWEGDNPDGHPSSIRLKVYKNGTLHKTVNVQAPAPHSEWSIPDLKKYDNGVENTYTVEEVPVPSYYTSYARVNEKSEITNTYHPYGNIIVSKTVEKSTDLSKDAQHSFNFSVSDEHGPYPGSWTIAIMPRDADDIDDATSVSTISNGETFNMSASQKAVIVSVPVNLEYTIAESSAPGYSPKAESEVSGTVSNTNPNETSIDSLNNVKFTNVYSAEGSVSLSAKKVLEGGELTANKFRFEVKDSDGNTVRMGSNAADGTVAFSKINFTLDDLDATGHGTKTFKITEMNLESPGYTYDEHEETVTVALTDNGNGTISAEPAYDQDGAVFTNKYEVEGSVPVRAYKSVPSWNEVINGFYDQHEYLERKDSKDILDGLFTFEATCDTLKQPEQTKLPIGQVQKFGSSNMNLDTGVPTSTNLRSDSKSKTISFPGANQIEAKIWMSQYSSSYSWLAMYPQNIAPSSSNYNSSLTSDEGRKGKINGPKNYQTSKVSITPFTLTYSGIDTIKPYFYARTYSYYYGCYVELNGYYVTDTYFSTARNDRDGNIIFDKADLINSNVGETYDIKIRETGINPDKKSEIGDELYNYLEEQIKMDEHEAVYSVKVTGKENGQIGYEASFNDTNSVFENTFDGNSILIEKYVDGDYPEDSEFTYHVTLDAPDGTSLPEGKTDVSASAAKAPFTVLYDANGKKFADGSTDGSSYKMIKYIWNGEAYAPTSPDADKLNETTDGLTLAGWKDENGNWVDVDAINTDATLIAQWVDAKLSNGTYSYSNSDGADFSWAVGKNGTLSIWGTKANLDKPTLALYYKNSFLNAGSGVPWYNQREFIKSIDVLTDDIDIIEGYTGIVMENDSYQGASSLFHRCKSLTDISELENWDLSKITRTSDLFSYCTSLSDFSPIAAWDMSTVKDIHGMFSHCIKLNDISFFRIWKLPDITTLAGLFNGCYELDDISALSNLDVSKCVSLAETFKGCTSLTSLAGIANWDVSSVRSTASMFENSSVASIAELAQWSSKLGSLENASKMFKGLCNTTDFTPVKDWNMSNVYNISYLFDGAFKISDISFVSDWKIADGVDVTGIFSNCYNITTVKIASENDKQIVSTIPVEKQFNTYSNEQDVSKMLLDVILSEPDQDYGVWNITTGASNIRAQGNQYATDQYSSSTQQIVVSDFKWILLKDGTMYILGNRNPNKVIIPSFWLCAVSDNYGGTTAPSADKADPWKEVRTSIKRFNSTVPVELSPGYSLGSSPQSYSGDQAAEKVTGLFEGCTALDSLDGIRDWNTDNMGSAIKMFSGCTSLKSLEPISNWKFPASAHNNTNIWSEYNYGGESASVFWHNMIAGSAITDITSITENLSIVSEVQKNNQTGSIFGGVNILVLSNAHIFSNSFEMVYRLSTYADENGLEHKLDEWSSYYDGKLTFVHPFTEVDLSMGAGQFHTEVKRNGANSIEVINWGIGSDGTLTLWSERGLNSTVYLPAYISGYGGEYPWNGNYSVTSINTPGKVVLCEPGDNYNQSYGQIVGIFQYCRNLTDISDIEDWDFSNISQLRYMFYQCTSILDLTPLNKASIGHCTTECLFGNTEDYGDIYRIAKIIIDSKTPSSFYSGLRGDDYTYFTNETGTRTTLTQILNSNMYGTWTREGFTEASSIYTGTYQQGEASFNWKLSNGVLTLSAVSGDTAVIPLAVPSADSIWYDQNDPYHSWLTYKIRSISVAPGTKLKAIDRATPTSTAGLFQKASSLTDISGLASMDTSSVTSISNLFASCTDLSNISALANWDMSNLNRCYQMLTGTRVSDFSPLSDWGTDSTVYADAFGTPSYVQAFKITEKTSPTLVRALMNIASDDTTFNGSNGKENVSAAIISSNISSKKSEYIGTWTNTVKVLLSNTVETYNSSYPGSYTWYMTDDNVLHFHANPSSTMHTDAAYIPVSYSSYDTNDTMPFVSRYPQLASVTSIDFGTAPVRIVAGQVGSYTEYRGLFEDYANLVDISDFTKSNVTLDTTSANGQNGNQLGFANMFKGCSSLVDASPIAKLGKTIPVANTKNMFAGCTNLSDITFFANWNLSYNITSTSTWDGYGAESMFAGCGKIAKVEIPSSNTYHTQILINQLPDTVRKSTFACGSNKDALQNVLNNGNAGVWIREIAPVAKDIIETGYYYNTYDKGCFSWTMKVDGTLELSPYSGSTTVPVGASVNTSDSDSVNPFSKYASMVSSIKVPVGAKLVNGSASASNASGIFSDLTRLTDITSLVNLDISSATYLTGLFKGDNSLSDISALRNWNTSKVVYTGYMFNGCSSLSDITVLSNWDMSNCTSMQYMFAKTSLNTLEPLGNWNTAKVTNISGMFNTIPTLGNISALGNWNMSKISSSYSYVSNFLSNSGTPQRIRIANKTASKQTAYKTISNQASIYENEETGVLSNLSTILNTWKEGNYSLFKPEGVDNLIHQGVYTNDGCNFSWGINDKGTLFIWEGTLRNDARVPTMFNSSAPWSAYQSEIKKVESKAPVTLIAPTSNYSFAGLFRGCSNLSDISSMRTWSNTSSKWGYMFEGCSSLKDISPLGGIDMSSVSTCTEIFTKCPIEKLYISDTTPTIMLNNLPNQLYVNTNGIRLSKSMLVQAPTNPDYRGEWSVYRPERVEDGAYGYYSEYSADFTWYVKDGTLHFDRGTKEKAILTDSTFSSTSPWSAFASQITSIHNDAPVCVNHASSTSYSSTGLFYGLSELENIDALAEWDVSQMTKMTYMFYGCKSLDNINALKNWSSAPISDMSYAFHGCESLHDVSALGSWTQSPSVNSLFLVSQDSATYKYTYCPIDTFTITPATGSNIRSSIYSVLTADVNNYNNTDYSTKVFKDKTSGRLATPSTFYQYGYSSSDFNGEWSPYVPEEAGELIAQGAYSRSYHAYGPAEFGWGVSEDGTLNLWSINTDNNLTVPLYWNAIGNDIHDAEVPWRDYLDTITSIKSFGSVTVSTTTSTFTGITTLFSMHKNLSDISKTASWSFNELSSARILLGGCHNLKDFSVINEWNILSESSNDIVYHAAMSLPSNIDTLTINASTPAWILAGIEGPNLFATFENESGASHPLIYLIMQANSKDESIYGTWTKKSENSDIAYARIIKDPSSDFVWILFKDGRLMIQNGFASTAVISPSLNNFVSASANLDNCLSFDIASAVKSIASKPDTSVMLADSTEMFSILFNDMENLTDISGMQSWDFSNISELPTLFANCPAVEDITSIAKWNLPDSINVSPAALAGLTGCRKVQIDTADASSAKSAIYNTLPGTVLFSNFTNGKMEAPLSSAISGGHLGTWTFASTSELDMTYGAGMLVPPTGNVCWRVDSEGLLHFWGNNELVIPMRSSYWTSSAWSSAAPHIKGIASSDSVKMIFGQEYMQTFFGTLTNIEHVNGMSNWDTSEITDISYAFASSPSLTDITGLYNQFQNATTYDHVFGSNINIRKLKFSSSDVKGIYQSIPGLTQQMTFTSNGTSMRLSDIIRSWSSYADRVWTCTGKTYDMVACGEQTNYYSWGVTKDNALCIWSYNAYGYAIVPISTYYLPWQEFASNIESIVFLSDAMFDQGTGNIPIFANLPKLTDVSKMAKHLTSSSVETRTVFGNSAGNITKFAVSNSYDFAVPCAIASGRGVFSATNASGQYMTFDAYTSYNSNYNGTWTMAPASMPLSLSYETSPLSELSEHINEAFESRAAYSPSFNTPSISSEEEYVASPAKVITGDANSLRSDSEIFELPNLFDMLFDTTEKTTSSNKPVSYAALGADVAVAQDASSQAVLLHSNTDAGIAKEITITDDSETVVLPELDNVYKLGKVNVGWSANPSASIDDADAWKVGDEVSASEVQGKTLYAIWGEGTTSIDISSGDFYVTIPANSSITLPEMPAGTAYKIVELLPSRWTQVKDYNSAGTVLPGERIAAAFSNSYTPDRTSTLLYVDTVISGQPENDPVVSLDGFTYQLLDEAGTVVATGTSDRFGSLTFANLYYTEPGTHTYTIKSIHGDETLIAYDDEPKKIVVNVEMSKDGDLVATPSDNGKATFEHKIDLSTEFTLDNKVEGYASDSSQFTYKVVFSDGTEDMITLAANQSKTISLPAGAQVASVELVALPQGFEKISESLTDDKENTDSFTTKANVMQPFYTSVSPEFCDKFGYTDEKNVPEKDENGYATVVAKSHIATFVSKYAATGSFQISASKTLLNAKLSDYEFFFDLKDAEGNIIDTVKSDSEGNIVFDTIEISTLPEGGKLEYTISERAGDLKYITYDSHVENVVVNVVDDGLGQYECEVVYDEDGAAFENEFFQALLPVTYYKMFIDLTSEIGHYAGDINGEATDNEDLLSKEFNVALKVEDGAGDDMSAIHYMILDENGKTVASGMFESGQSIKAKHGQSIVLDEMEESMCAYVQQSTEPAWSTAHIITNDYSANPTQASRSVHKRAMLNQDQNLMHLYNVYYAEGKWAAAATKVFEKGVLAQDMFSFALTGDDGTEYTAYSNAAGEIVFPEIIFDSASAGQIHTYTMSEDIDNARDDIIYDQSVYTINVEIGKLGEDKLDIVSTISKDGEQVDDIVFTNIYNPKVELPFTGKSGIGILVGVGMILVLIPLAARIRRRRQSDSPTE